MTNPTPDTPGPAMIPLNAVVNVRPEKFSPTSRRKILCVFPRYTHSFGTFDHAFPLIGVKGFMPPQGILVIAAYMPEEWEVRFIDENVRRATDADFRWADAVFLSGMHVQRDHVMELAHRAQSLGRVTVLGGPSVSSCPEWYEGVDMLHVGEIGDATDAIIRRLDASCARPERQEVYRTEEKLPLADFPLPAYHLLRMDDYLMGSVQFSSGCPYRCEFCDIPELYGRNPRLKDPKQVTRELDAMIAAGSVGAVYFVDDNFIGNPKAAVSLAKELVAWQEARGFPLQFACEATLNISKQTELLGMLRDANFRTVFCGIESPDEDALKSMQKTQNLPKALHSPILEAIETLNGYGLEVVSGIIMGLDTDTPETGRRIARFVGESNIPLLTINILHALPNTPLWRRLEKENRILNAPDRDSNVEFLLPYETVVNSWRECITEVYTPENVYARFQHQLEHTYPNRRPLPATKARVNAKSILKGVGILGRILWRVGVRSDYRRLFWRMALPNLRKLKIEEVIQVSMVSHHLILFARECASGQAEKCFYSAPVTERAPREEAVPV